MVASAMLVFKCIKYSRSTIRFYSSVVYQNESYLIVKNYETKGQKFPYFWLRDHCRCSKCYNKNTEQINFNIVDIPLDCKPKCLREEEDTLKITWDCDNHESEYSINWLKSINFDNSSVSHKEIKYWNKYDLNIFTDSKVDYKSFFGSNEGKRKLLKSIIKYGFGYVTDVETSIEGTENVVSEIGLVKTTLFGGMWEVTNDAAHNDTAYSQISLLPHNDNTYFSDASGLQVFHMLSHEGSGGETLMVDGFNGCMRLKQQHKEAFDLLCNVPVTARYLEEGYHYSLTDPIIKLHPLTKELYQLRYNIFDREVLTSIPYEGIMKFYEAYVLLGKELFSKDAVYSVKLAPGEVLFIDNWRVLHGRSAYTGVRRLCGCYVGRDDWISKAQYLGLNVL